MEGVARRDQRAEVRFGTVETRGEACEDALNSELPRGQSMAARPRETKLPVEGKEPGNLTENIVRQLGLCCEESD